MSNNDVTKKVEILNEEIGRYYVDFEETYRELIINYASLRKKANFTSTYSELSSLRYAVEDLKNSSLSPKVNLEDVEIRIADLSDKFEAIIDLSKKAREYLTAIKIDATSIAAFKKALNS